MHPLEPPSDRDSDRDLEPEPGSNDPGRLARADLRIGTRARRLRRFWRTIPSAPRCKMCNSPFGPPGGPLMRLIGKGRWQGNSQYCAGCFKYLYRNRDGAEIDCTLLFADIRGSTQLAESMTASQFRRLLDRFYNTAARVLIEHEAIVDKFVGDEVIGIFVPALAGGDHARRGVDTALALLRATGSDTDAPWVPIGIGVNTGIAFVGVVGGADHVEFTALGDNVNVTARLASAARRGEVLVTDRTVQGAGLALDGVERRRLDLRGRSEATEVAVLRLAAAELATTS
ncbi:MAG TPA: adenylate/guanylate cyclase domain-containing protein [Candidatus Limnocylindria bacterium]|nr:adenylate/guanylate cyclase domain-containing protein [Candidatus Limnocylindria bacterium]